MAFGLLWRDELMGTPSFLPGYEHADLDGCATSGSRLPPHGITSPAEVRLRVLITNGFVW